LDYEEVLYRSNVPQLLVSAQGLVVAWNDFFLRISGLSSEDMERMTMFSLVEPAMLSDLFAISARVLRSNSLSELNTERKSNDPDTCPINESLAGGDISSNLLTLPSHDIARNYEAVTVPCVKFRPLIQQALLLGQNESRPLYLTLTLMPDDDPRKRCFHGVFTDRPGPKGGIGSVSPELLSL
jgi:PAS domain-containing protein